MAVKSGECDVGLVVGMEQMGKMGLLVLSDRQPGDVFEPSGRYGAVVDVEGVLGTNLMPGWFALIGTEYAHVILASGSTSSRVSPRRTTRTRR